MTSLRLMTFTSYIRRQSSAEDSSMVARPNAPPALLTSTCAPPSSRTRSAIRSTSASTVTSATSTSAPVSSASASSRSARRATPSTSQPFARNLRTVAAPIPLDAPVITARFAMLTTYPS